MSLAPLRPTRQLVGRAGELSALTDAVETALGSRSRFVLLEGAPGVGKSTLAHEVGRRAEARNFLVVVLRGREPPSAPYGAAARLIERLTGLTSLVDAERLDILQAALRGLHEELATRPVALIVDDAQWLDSASAEVLEYLLLADPLSLERQPLLVLATARTGEMAVGPGRGLGRLRQLPGFLHLDLAEIDEAATAALAREVCGAPLDLTALRTLREVAGGNPLRLTTMLEAAWRSGAIELTDGLVVERPGRWPLATRLDTDQLLGDTLASLPSHADDVAVRAALLGDDGSIDDLLAVCPSESDTLGALTEMNRRGILVDDGTTFRFVHPEWRRVAADRAGGRRRQEIHAQLARHLVEQRREGRAHVALLHEHVQAAGDAFDPVTRCRIALESARAAAHHEVWAAASACYRAALRDLPALELDRRGRAVVLAEAAHACWMDCDPSRARDLYLEVAREGAGLDDAGLWGKAVEGHLRAAMLSAGGAREQTVDERPVAEYLAHAAGERTPERTSVLVALADLRFEQLRPEDGLALSEAACSMAIELDDDRERARTHYSRGLLRLGLLEVAQASSDFASCAELAKSAGDPLLRSWGGDRLATTHWLRGDLDRAVELGHEMLRFNAEHALWQCLSLTATYLTAAAVARGSFDQAGDLGAHAQALIVRSDYPSAGPLLFPHLLASTALRGDHEGSNDVIARAAALECPIPQYLRRLATPDDTSRAASRRTAFQEPRLFDITRLVIRALESRETGPLPAGGAHALERAVGNGLHIAPQWPVLLTRALGCDAAARGRRDDAAAWFEHASVVAASAGFDVEAAALLLDRALLAHDGGNLRSAARLGLAAARAAAGLGLRPLHRRALAFVDGLPATELPEADGPERHLVYTDLVGSTMLNARVGDQRFVALLEEHSRIIRTCAARHGGVPFHSTGDGYGIWFTDAAQAADCAFDTHQALARASAAHPDYALVARIGIACGSTLPLEGDLYGMAVVRAVRICALADSGAVLVSEPVARALPPSRFRTTGERIVRLKGFDKDELIVQAMRR